MRLIIFGPPGAGKGTQAKLLSSHLSIPHLSTGEILRSKLQDKDNLALKLKKIMSTGQLVSDEILNEIVSKKILSNKCKKGFILDGYPRTLKQLNYLDLFLVNKKVNLDIILNLQLNEETIENRLVERSKIENREDDSNDTILTRIITYNTETRPIIEFYKRKYPKIFFELNGEQKIENIQSEIIKILRKC